MPGSEGRDLLTRGRGKAPVETALRLAIGALILRVCWLALRDGVGVPGLRRRCLVRVEIDELLAIGYSSAGLLGEVPKGSVWVVLVVSITKADLRLVYNRISLGKEFVQLEMGWVRSCFFIRPSPQVVGSRP